MAKFNHLNIPDQWNSYWSKYPQGYTILEALINWVSQVDQLTDNINDWNLQLDDFILTFDTNLQSKVATVLQDWNNSGFFNELFAQEILDLKADKSELDLKADKSELVEISELIEIGAIGYSNTTTQTTYTDGILTGVVESQNSVPVITTGLEYNLAGELITVTEQYNDKTLTTSLSYVDGEISSVDKTVVGAV